MPVRYPRWLVETQSKSFDGCVGERTMFTALLAVSLAYDPVPKAESEGRIALISWSKSKEEVVILKNNGTVEKRFELVGELQHAFRIRLNRDGQSALVLCDEGRGIGGRQTDGFLVDLTGKNKPKRYFNNKSQVEWFFSNAGSFAYVSLRDDEKFIAQKNGLPIQFVNSMLDLKTDLFKPISLSSDHKIINISSDDQKLLTFTQNKGQHFNDKPRFATVQVKTWKIELLPKTFGSAQDISFDGKKILTWDLNPEMKLANTEDQKLGRLIVFDLANKKKQKIRLPEKVHSQYDSVFSPDGKRVCYLAFDWNDERKEHVNYRLIRTIPESDSTQIIYQAKDDEKIFDFDWR